MGRPFTVIGLSMFASLFFICALGVTAAYVVLAVAVIALIIFVSIKKLRRNVAIIVSLAAVIFAGGLYVGTYHFAYLPSEQYFGKEASVSGTLKDYPDYEYHRYYAEIKVKTIGGNEVRPFVMRISFPDYIEAQPGDTLTCKAVISESGTASRFSKLNYLSKGVFASAYCADEPVVEENTDAWKGLSVYLAQYRHFICENLRNVLPKSHAALASAVLIGEKSYIDSDTLTNINNAGISHIICVSGLHLSIIAAALLKLFTALKVSRKLKYISCAGFIIFFMALCGFTSSVVRAGMMFLVYIAAELMLAEPDSLNSLGLAAFVILLNPFNAGNIGFIFSFSATLAIILCGSRVIDYLKEKWEISECSKVKKCLFSLLEIVIISVFVNAFCMPFSILIFQKFSLISIIANVFILPFASMLLISCALCALFAMLPLSVFGFIIYPVAAFASLMCAYTLKVVDILAGIPFSNVYAGSAPLLCACACVLLLIVLLIFMRKNKKVYTAAGIVMAIVFAASAAFQYYLNVSRMEVRICSLKSNVCITAHAGKDFVLIDAGNSPMVPSKIAESMFRSASEDIDYFLICGSAKKHCGKARQVFRDFDVRHCILPQNAQDAQYLDIGEQTQTQTSAYTAFSTDSGMSVSYYALKFAAVHITYKEQSILFVSTGDADISVLPEHMQQANYLIVAGKVNSLFSNMQTNAIIEIDKETKNPTDTTESILFSTSQSRDITITVSSAKSTIGRSNAWQQ